MPDRVRCFTEYLRQAGYYCSNCSKEDYNFATPATAWDESSDKAHWRKRADGRSFYDLGRENYTVPAADLDAEDAAARFWAVMRLYQQQKESAPEWLDKLEALLADPSPAVRVAAAGLLHRYRPKKALPVLIQELQSPDEWTRLQAANELDPLGHAAKPALEIFRKLVDDPNQYVVRVAQHAVKTVNPEESPRIRT